MKKANAIYDIPCKNCEKSYRGETGRALHIRTTEHEKEFEKFSHISAFTRQQKQLIMSDIFKSAAAEHAVKENHILDLENIKVLEYEADWGLRGIKEAIQIRSNEKSMNREGGERYELSHIWNSVLARSKEKKNKISGGRGHGRIRSSR